MVAISKIIKNKYIRLFIYAIVFVILVRLVLVVLMVGAVGGNFGLRAMSHRCIGLTLSYETVSKYFPEGKIELLGFEYFVPKKAEIQKDQERNCSKDTWRWLQNSFWCKIRVQVELTNDFYSYDTSKTQILSLGYYREAI